MKEHPIRDFMTPGAYTIGHDRPLLEAQHLMREHAIRHLPVLQGGKVVGILSQRDVHLVSTLKDVRLEEVQVEEAMSQDPYLVEPGTPLGEVAEHMAEHRFGSAVIAHHDRVLGIFTCVDALFALHKVLGPSDKGNARKKHPAE